jgi:cobalt-zinc-cadmium efflux system protein
LLVVFGLVLAFMLAEFVAGYLTGSLALVSDAGHMATDALGLGMALAAITAASRVGAEGRHTYGLYRLEILAALANALLLFLVAGYVIYEAFNRLSDPPDILSGPMLVVAVLGLAVNIVGWWLLRDGASESMNVEGAFMEVVADLLASVGVIVAALVVIFTGWVYVDAIVGAAIGLFILPRAYRLGRRALRVLIQAAPDDMDMADLRSRLESIPQVTDVHDLHVWTLTSGMPVATVHLAAGDMADRDLVMARARRVLRDEFRVTHATLQVESGDQDCSEITW